MNLSSLIAKGSALTEKTAVVVWRDGVQFTVRYISRQTLQQIAENCAVFVFNPETKRRERKIDPERWANSVTTRIVVGWSGLTLRKMSRFTPLDTSKLEPEQLDTEIPFTEENLMALVTNTPELDDFLQDSASDLSIFQTINEEDLRKNSSSSPSTT